MFISQRIEKSSPKLDVSVLDLVDIPNKNFGLLPFFGGCSHQYLYNLLAF